MRSTVLLALSATLLVAAPIAAQERPDATPSSVFTDLDENLAVVKSKLLGLAAAIPDETYDWRPGEGVRSVRETLLHVAADNYFIPIALGHTPPAYAGISDEYSSAKAFEEQELTKVEVEAVLEESFDYLQRLLAASDPGSEEEAVSLFGQDSTVRKTWILTTTHLHEHLGQMIAYARTNGVVPPWSM